MQKKILPAFALLSLAVGFIAPAQAGRLTVREDRASQTIAVFRAGEAKAILTQNARADSRPYIHPLVAPDGHGVLTEAASGQPDGPAGLFWGLAKVNDRDYLHHAGKDYWRRVSSRVITAEGEDVKWETVYELLDQAGQPIMIETQAWTMRDDGKRYLLDLEWTGKALKDIVVGEAKSGGLTLRGPWRAGAEPSIVNSQRQDNARAAGQNAVWLDVGMKPDGRKDEVHVMIFDNPDNAGFPQAWHVDPAAGVGPSRALGGEWKIAKDQQAVYRNHLVVSTGAFNNIAANEDWKAYSGENDGRAWIRSREEAKKAKLLTPEQALAKMTVVDGLEVKLAASEPMITQPIAFCWDDRGRLWVAENLDYESRSKGFSKYGDSRIVILEDTNGDGVMDKRTVFIEGIPFPSTIAVGMGGLWLGAAPNLLFIPDRNHDDKPDGDIEVKLTGWGIRDRHEVVNSLSWGPDGWLYGCEGYATASFVGKPLDGKGRLFKKGEAFPENVQVKDGQKFDGGVWRYHPTKDRFEIVAAGFSNPWGIDFDDHGQIFITACVIPHLWYVIPGGYYQRQGGSHYNPYVYSDITTIADHRHLSAHGGARIYLADEFPAQYRNRIFMGNIHEHAVLTDILEPQGSGFVGHHGDDTLLANDPMWVGFAVEIGPDGAVYVLDWHDADICGTDVLEKDTGRLYRLAPKGLAGSTGINLGALSDHELVALQLNHNDWYVRRARLLLQQHAAEGKLAAGTHEELWKMYQEQKDSGRQLRALWALHVTGGLPHDRLVGLLDSPEPYVRGWAVQLLCEDSTPGEDALKKFATMSQQEASPVVRLYLTAALRRLALAERWPIAQALIRHPEDAEDHNLPKMLWFGVEPLVMDNTSKALALATPDSMPLVSKFIARRAAAGGQFEAVATALLATKDATVRQLLLEGMRDGLQGSSGIALPANWAQVQQELTASGDAKLGDLLLQVGQLFGDAKAADAQLVIMQDPKTATERRRAILQAFAQKGFAPALPATLVLLDDPALRRDAIRALASFSDPRVPAEILNRYAGWSGTEKAEAILTLSARRPSAELLLNALKTQKIPRDDISAYNRRQLSRVLGPAFVDFWGKIDIVPEEKLALMAKYRALLTDEALARANVANGRVLFERTCAICHTLYGNGGKIGPDLTGSNRGNLSYILNEILNPSDVIQEGYQLVTILTRDGRTLAGNVASENDQQLTLRLIGQDTIVAKSEIMSREKSPVSMMPEGLLNSLKDNEVKDLIAYLRTQKQVDLPK